MDRIENLRKHAVEAANSEFFWNLGFLAPSRRQAYDVCILWCLSEKDQKRVTSVTALRDQAPEVLEEIRRAAFPEENKMVEVLVGPKHYEREAQRKDEELWRNIIKRLGIRSYFELRKEMESERFPITTPTTASDLEEKLPKVAWHDLNVFSRIHFVGRPRVKISDDGVPILEIIPSWSTCPGHAVISIWPIWAHFNDGIEKGLKGNLIQKENAANSFYIPKGVSTSMKVDLGPKMPHYVIAGPRWSNAVISVEKSSFLPFAKKVANAYEQETARRRKPAKAFVLKNY